MPRTARASAGGYCYHVLDRGNGRATVFHKPRDYEASLALIAEATPRTPMRLLAYRLMPNHFHLVLRPHGAGDLGRWMHRLMTAHVRRYCGHYHTSGHVWQGRFKTLSTMFKSGPRGGANKRGRTDSIDDADLLRSDLDACHYGTDDLSPVMPGRGGQASLHSLCEILEAL
jgi:REP element-mobilizing transposase RayT